MSGAQKTKTSASCPICGRPAEADLAPFCSARCADIDLGRWLGERYVIPDDDDAGTDPPEPKHDQA